MSKIAAQSTAINAATLNPATENQLVAAILQSLLGLICLGVGLLILIAILTIIAAKQARKRENQAVL